MRASTARGSGARCWIAAMNASLEAAIRLASEAAAEIARQTRRTVPITFSIMLVQASERRNSAGSPSLVTVSISSRPSRIEAETPCQSRSRRRARLRRSFSSAVTALRASNLHDPLVLRVDDSAAVLNLVPLGRQGMPRTFGYCAIGVDVATLLELAHRVTGAVIEVSRNRLHVKDALHLLHTVSIDSVTQDVEGVATRVRCLRARGGKSNEGSGKGDGEADSGKLLRTLDTNRPYTGSNGVEGHGGAIVAVEPFPEARKAAFKLTIDFGDDTISSEEQAYIRYDSAERSFLFVPNLAKTNIVSVNDKRPAGAVFDEVDQASPNAADGGDLHLFGANSLFKLLNAKRRCTTERCGHTVDPQADRADAGAEVVLPHRLQHVAPRRVRRRDELCRRC